MFTPRAYKRNYRHSLLRKLFASKRIESNCAKYEDNSGSSYKVSGQQCSIRRGRNTVASGKIDASFLTPLSRSHSQRALDAEIESSEAQFLDVQIRKNSAKHPVKMFNRVVHKRFYPADDPLSLTTWEIPASPLIEACKRQSGTPLETFIGESCNVNTKYRTSVILTAIHVATIHGRSDAVRVLLEHGANIDEPAELGQEDSMFAGWRPLHFAVWRGDQPLAELLLRQGANVFAQSLHGHQAIHAAAAKCERLDIVQLLLEYSANINAKTAKGETPLRLAPGKWKD